MKANYISPKIDIIHVDVTCIYAGSPGGDNTVTTGKHEGETDEEENDFARQNAFSDLW